MGLTCLIFASSDVELNDSNCVISCLLPVGAHISHDGVTALSSSVCTTTTLYTRGGRRANLSNEVQAWFEEVALDEQGHVRSAPFSSCF